MAFGPAAGLALVDALTGEPALKTYHLLPAVRGDLLAKLGRADEARAEFERAASLTRNARERDLMLERADEAARRAGVPDEKTRVDVNEQNEPAVKFYLLMGFAIEGRSDLDGTGKPFPLLHLRLGEVKGSCREPHAAA